MKKVFGEDTETYQRAEKYVLAKGKGLSKEKAKKVAGYAPTTSTTQIEESDVYEKAELTLKEAILGQITQEELATLLARNAKQDTNINASNKALEIAMDRVEPDSKPNKKEEQIVVVMRK